MNAFVTGSRAYGKPGDGSEGPGDDEKLSDLDLAVLVSPADAGRLRAFSDLLAQIDGANKVRRDSHRSQLYPERPDGGWDQSIHFGHLNLLVFVDPDKFAAWRVGNAYLKARLDKKYYDSPTRDQAVDVLETLEAMLTGTVPGHTDHGKRLLRESGARYDHDRPARIEHKQPPEDQQ